MRVSLRRCSPASSARRRASPAISGGWRTRAATIRHAAVLVRRALEPEFEEQLLEPTGRGLPSATFSLGSGPADGPGTGRGVAYSVHLDVFDRERRRSQALEIARIASARPSGLAVVGGDFNLDVELAGRLGNQDDVETFGELARGFVDAGREPTLFGLLRVDHLLSRGPRLGQARVRVSPGRRLPLGDQIRWFWTSTSSARLTGAGGAHSIGWGRPMVEHRRSDRRYDCRLEIDLAYEGAWFGAYTRNISLGGALIETDRTLPFGAKVSLRFRVPTQVEPIEVDGQVRWQESEDGQVKGTGIRFEGLRPRDVWALNEYFEQAAESK